MQSKFRRYIQGVLSVGLLVFSLAGCDNGERQAEKEALDFLYASMPLPDSVDYPREFWGRSVRTTLRARREMPWGEKVPEREWKHFVLPVRVNNENLDDSRTVLYEELKERVAGMRMYNAILEVNHWCHEHVTYQPSDARTSSPLATMRSAIGRCGEESTFTVSALRAVGIPARQVYTPRWAHTDDNHAWVEAWADGKWYFLGACEPEPVLNLGWFNAPAARGMLMHTRVFGRYEGAEEVISSNRCYTEINVTSNYAPVDTVVVRTIDVDGSPVADARVDYRIYNYAEFYTMVSRTSDADGLSSLVCGKGDLLVWASKDGRFGFAKACVGSQDTVDVVIDKDDSYTASIDFDIVPPEERNTSPDLSGKQITDNRRRLAREDSIRNAYMEETFYRSDDNSDPRVKARANWKVIQDFMEGEAGNTVAGKAILATLRDKDYRDVTAEVLADHALNTVAGEGDIWQRYVLCPRVGNEMLTPYRKVLSEVFRGMDAEGVFQWVRDSIAIDSVRNPQQLCMSPLGVMRHRIADPHSRNVFFVAAARSAGIAARLDEVTGKVQCYAGESGWEDMDFDGPASSGIAPCGTLRLSYNDFRVAEHPAYYTHFSLSRISGGRLRLQEFPEGTKWEDGFAGGAEVEAGRYLLVSGTRMADGKVLAHLEFFGVPADGSAGVPLRLRDDDKELRVIGTFDCENRFTNHKGIHKTILKTTGRGYYMVGLVNNNEPSAHLLHEMEEANIYLSQWPHCFLMLFPSQEEYAHFRRQDYDGLPYNFVFGVADPETVEAMHIQELTHGSTELPILLLADTFNRVVWFKQGYSIGTAEQIMKTIRRLLKTDTP